MAAWDFNATPPHACDLRKYVLSLVLALGLEGVIQGQ